MSRAAQAWLPLARLAAAPFALLEVLIERGNYPAGYERWAWLVTGVFVFGAALLVLLQRRGLPGAAPAGLALDFAVVSSYVAVYSFEPGSPVRQLFFLVVVEAGLLYGRLGGGLTPLAAVPALGFFEWEVADRLTLPFDPGHVLAPVALTLVVGLVVGTLAERPGRVFEP